MLTVTSVSGTYALEGGAGCRIQRGCVRFAVVRVREELRKNADYDTPPTMTTRNEMIPKATASWLGSTHSCRRPSCSAPTTATAHQTPSRQQPHLITPPHHHTDTIPPRTVCDWSPANDVGNPNIKHTTKERGDQTQTTQQHSRPAAPSWSVGSPKGRPRFTMIRR